MELYRDSEGRIIPIFILISKYGSRINRIEAAYRFFLYTMLGSLFIIIGIKIPFFFKINK